MLIEVKWQLVYDGDRKKFYQGMRDRLVKFLWEIPEFEDKLEVYDFDFTLDANFEEETDNKTDS